MSSEEAHSIRYVLNCDKRVKTFLMISKKSQALCPHIRVRFTTKKCDAVCVCCFKYHWVKRQPAPKTFSRSNWAFPKMQQEVGGWIMRRGVKQRGWVEGWLNEWVRRLIWNDIVFKCHICLYKCMCISVHVGVAFLWKETLWAVTGCAHFTLKTTVSI